MTQIDDFSPMVERGELKPSSGPFGRPRAGDPGAVAPGFSRVFLAVDGAPIAHEPGGSDLLRARPCSWVVVDVRPHTLRYAVEFSDPTGRAGFTARVEVVARVRDPDEIATRRITSVKDVILPAVRRAVLQATKAMRASTEPDPLAALDALLAEANACLRDEVRGEVPGIPGWLDASFVAVGAGFDEATRQHVAEIVARQRPGRRGAARGDIDGDRERVIRELWLDPRLPDTHSDMRLLLADAGRLDVTALMLLDTLREGADAGVAVRHLDGHPSPSAPPPPLTPTAPTWNPPSVPPAVPPPVTPPRAPATPPATDPHALDVVDCTVFAPPEAAPGESILVQVFVHLPFQDADVRGLATEFDADAKRRAVQGLKTEVERGSILQVALQIAGADVEDPVQSLVWRGRATSVQFGAVVAPSGEARTLLATVQILQSSIPIGHIRFKLEVSARARAEVPASLPVGDDASRYRTAFLSHAREDRDQVVRAAQLLRSVDIQTFQDRVDMGPGEEWEQRLYREIAGSDLFLLFWSRAARASDWVRREAVFALGEELVPRPEMRPVILERPPCLPWPELAHLNFNDPLTYFITEGPES